MCVCAMRVATAARSFTQHQSHVRVVLPQSAVCSQLPAAKTIAEQSWQVSGGNKLQIHLLGLPGSLLLGSVLFCSVVGRYQPNENQAKSRAQRRVNQRNVPATCFLECRRCC